MLDLGRLQPVLQIKSAQIKHFKTYFKKLYSGWTVFFLRWGDVTVDGGLERDNVVQAFYNEHFQDRDRRVVAANLSPLSPRPRRRVKVYRFLLTGLVHT